MASTATASPTTAASAGALPVSNRATPSVWRHIGATAAPSAGAGVEQTTPVLVVGAGPVGLAMALDLGLRGHQVLLISKLPYIAGGSKAICFSKRSLDILDRLGVGRELLAKGVTWNVGKVFWGAGAEPIYQFDMQPVKDQQYPGFINLQQYYVEEALLQALQSLPNVQVRLGQQVEALTPTADHVLVDVLAGEVRYRVQADWVVACDGSRSVVRNLMGLDFDGRVFEENFLIADVRMAQERPPERWFWFDPPFNPGQSALMHRQPDGVWRLDFQLGWGIDRQASVKPENVERYVRAMLGEDVEFTEEWYSIYTFQCRRMRRFVHDRVLFAGDSAHLVSPFGARGCNGGFADIDNLGWKLDLVLRSQAGRALLESYNDEAITTADENILNSTRSTDFLTPKTTASKAFRDAVLELASQEVFARPFVNSGRLSTAVHYPGSSLNTPDAEHWQGGVAPGAPAVDAPWGDAWLLGQLGRGFVLLTHGAGDTAIAADWPEGMVCMDVAALPSMPQLLVDRYQLQPGACYLIRPDHYVAARWQSPPSMDQIRASWQRALGGLQ